MDHFTILMKKMDELRAKMEGGILYLIKENKELKEENLRLIQENRILRGDL